MVVRWELSELISVVNDQDEVVGSEEKTIVHKKGLWHRVVVVWIVNSQGKVLIQKRNFAGDEIHGWWDHSCAGHVDAGEEPIKAAYRELKEELGIESELVFLKKYKYEEKIGSKNLRRFWYIYKSQYDAEFEIDLAEVGEVKFVDSDWLSMDIVVNKGNFSPSLRHTLKVLREEIYENN